MKPSRPEGLRTHRHLRLPPHNILAYDLEISMYSNRRLGRAIPAVTIAAAMALGACGGSGSVAGSTSATATHSRSTSPTHGGGMDGPTVTGGRARGPHNAADTAFTTM